LSKAVSGGAGSIGHRAWGIGQRAKGRGHGAWGRMQDPHISDFGLRICGMRTFTLRIAGYGFWTG